MGASTSSPGQAKKEACGGSGQIVVSGALWFVKTDEDVLSLLADLPPPVFSLVLALVCTRVTTMIRLESVCRFLFHTLRGHAPHRLVANPWIAFAQMRRVPELKTREQFVVWSGNQCHPWYSRVMLKQTQNELRAYLLEHGATGMTPSSRIRGLEGLFRIEGLQKKNLILMTGLRGVGKSSILRGLGCAITLTTPIVGVDVETVAFEAGSVECSEIWSWEAGLGLQLKPVWDTLYQIATAVIFVADASDREQVGYAGQELLLNLLRKVKTSIVLVLVTRMDQSGSMSLPEITYKLGLEKTKHLVRLQPCTAGDSRVELGLKWCHDAIRSKLVFDSSSLTFV